MKENHHISMGWHTKKVDIKYTTSGCRGTRSWMMMASSVAV